MNLIYIALILLILFSFGWLVAVRINNVSIVDAMWALSLPIPVTLYVMFNNGSLERKIILLSMALIWSLRLGIHLSRRIARHHPQEDPRYASLRKRWEKKNPNLRFYIIFQVNALLVFLLSLPFYASSQYHAPIQMIEWIGLAIFTIGLIGETIADRQLAMFRLSNTNKVICELGLWNYSRHPNYFFEAVIWIGIYLFACGADGGVYTIHAPIIMIIFLTKISGIPPAEISSLKSKGDAYRKYQQSTSAFVPWFKKETS